MTPPIFSQCDDPPAELVAGILHRGASWLSRFVEKFQDLELARLGNLGCNWCGLAWNLDGTRQGFVCQFRDSTARMATPHRCGRAAKGVEIKPGTIQLLNLAAMLRTSGLVHASSNAPQS